MLLFEIIIGILGGLLFAEMGNMGWNPAAIAKVKHGTLYNKTSILGFLFALAAWSVLPLGIINEAHNGKEIIFSTAIIVQIFRLAPLKLKFSKQKKHKHMKNLCLLALILPALSACGIVGAASSAARTTIKIIKAPIDILVENDTENSDKKTTMAYSEKP